MEAGERAGPKGGYSGTLKGRGGRELMAFPERKQGKVPGRDKVGGRGGPGLGSRTRTPGFVQVSGVASCPAGAPGVPPDPAPRPRDPGLQLLRCLREGAWGLESLGQGGRANHGREGREGDR